MPFRKPSLDLSPVGAPGCVGVYLSPTGGAEGVAGEEACWLSPVGLWPRASPHHVFWGDLLPVSSRKQIPDLKEKVSGEKYMQAPTQSPPSQKKLQHPPYKYLHPRECLSLPEAPRGRIKNPAFQDGTVEGRALISSYESTKTVTSC